MGRSLALSAARRVRLAVSGQSAYATPAMLKQSTTYDYERVGVSSTEERPSRPVRLGGRSRIRIAGLQGLLHTPSSLLSRLRASYGKLRETAKETNVNVYDLFVGNQMLMHVCATPLRPYKKKVTPTIAAPRNSKLSKVPSSKGFRVGRSASFKHRL
ncbi:hypothetical protein MPTK1_8g13530 [Marchantia polymorpha subsp. ruderalis]|uniref:Uncharacterized protein n=1 Tax=Marchantia polymorpha TaxID=3197 RepID=A0A2R6WCG4_MARPO|nr:hypothetical protein MARPO_0110s0036 [Marchantia polymorpha]BBN19773.1 hypothetical protein Mp_8g13530 [Marchantia polymorpha subsp. ruderalis]|eukprot:PTQ31545.1 hypothetical protein MARPO_0110s0036 [Marchantia polymorpha]